MKNQWLIFDLIAVLDILNMINGSDCGCGTQKMGFSFMGFDNPKLPSGYCSSASCIHTDFGNPMGGGLTKRFFPFKDFWGVLRNPHILSDPFPNMGFLCF